MDFYNSQKKNFKAVIRRCRVHFVFSQPEMVKAYVFLQHDGELPLLITIVPNSLKGHFLERWFGRVGPIWNFSPLIKKNFFEITKNLKGLL